MQTIRRRFFVGIKGAVAPQRGLDALVLEFQQFDDVLDLLIQPLITFDERRDAVVVNWLNALQHRLRSGAIKSVLRCSIAHPCLYAHFKTLPAASSPKKPKGVQPAGKAAGISKPVTPGAVKPAKEIPAIPPAQPSDDLPDDFDIFTMEFKEL